MMDDFEKQIFEKQIKEALARKEPSPFFEARVLGALKRHQKERRASSRMWWASAVAGIFLVITGSVWQRQRITREQAAGEDAKARLELALKITSVKLQRISRKVEGI
jgi:hypothetical protein